MKHFLKIGHSTLHLSRERVSSRNVHISNLNLLIAKTKLISRLRQKFNNGPCAIKFLGRNFSIPDYSTFSSELTDIFVSGRDFFEADSESPKIVDIGANVGFGTFYFKLLYPKAQIRNFEADPAIHAYLVKNIGDMEGVVSENLAVGDGTTKTLYRASNSLSSTTIESFKQGGEKISVPGIALSDILVNEIDLLKVDCEGAEFQMIRGVDSKKLRLAKRIFMEVHFVPGESIPALLKTIEDAGFDVYVIETSMTHIQVLEGNPSHRIEIDCIRR